VRLVGGRIDMSVDGVVVATWTDTSPLPVANFGLATFQGKASFDDLTLLDITGTGTRDAFRSYYAFGAGVIAVRDLQIPAGDGATAAWGSAAPVYWLHGEGISDCGFGIADCLRPAQRDWLPATAAQSEIRNPKSEIAGASPAGGCRRAWGWCCSAHVAHHRQLRSSTTIR
jgi:hypothetical protein